MSYIIHILTNLNKYYAWEYFNKNPVLSSFMIYHLFCRNAMGVTNGAGTAYSSGAPEFTPSFQ